MSHGERMWSARLRDASGSERPGHGLQRTTYPAASIEEIAEVGLEIESPWDLVNMRRSYRAAVPVLIAWLEHVDDEIQIGDRMAFREALVRSLAVKEARGVAAPALLREFRRNDSPEYRWAVGNTLEVVVDDSVVDETAALAKDRSYGRDRQWSCWRLAGCRIPALSMSSWGCSTTSPLRVTR